MSLTFAEQGAPLRFVFHLHDPFEFLQQLALSFADLGRSLHTNLHKQIALAASVQNRHAFAADAERAAGLGSLRHFEGMFTLKRRNIDFRAQCSLGDRDWDHAVQVVSLPARKRMLLDVQHHVEVAGRTARQAALPLTRETDAGSILDAGGNFGIHGTLPKNAALPLALCARVGDDAPGALAGRTSARNTEKSLLVAHLAPSGTGTAGHGRFAGRGARSTAFFAGLVAAHRNLGFGAENRPPQIQD